MTSRPTSTVVVATYQRPEELQRLVDGLASQQHPPQEVIVVDDGSIPPAAPNFPDATDSAISWSLIRQDNAGPGVARDTGIRAATGDVIVITDDDIIVNDRFVAAHVEMHAAGHEVVQGRFDDIGDHQRPLFDLFIDGSQQAYFDRLSTDPSSIEPPRFATGNVSFRRQLYLDVGGFDRTLRRREDSELGVRFGAAGADFAFCPEQTAQHAEEPETLDRWLRVAFQYGEADHAIAQRHRDVYRPWALYDDLPLLVRAIIRLTAGRPSLMRGVGVGAAQIARILGAIRLRSVAVKIYGLAYALHWFAGFCTAIGPSAPHELRSRHAVDDDDRARRVSFGDIDVDVIDLEGSVARIIELANAGRTGVVVTPNVDHLVLQRTDDAFAATYARADLVLADGMPMVLMAKLLRLPLTEKVSGSDLILPMLDGAADAKIPVYLLGATDETSKVAAQRLLERRPDLDIVGRSSPWFTPGAENAEVAAALDEIERTGARLVVLAFGAPKQEQLLDHFSDRLPAACFVALGASLDFVAGSVSRAPAWMSKYGLEWTYRLYKEPRRLWKRYIIRDSQAVPIFARMIWARLRGRELVTIVDGDAT